MAISAAAQADYTRLLAQISAAQASATASDGAQKIDLVALQNAVDAYSRDPGVDAAMAQKFQAKLGDLMDAVADDSAAARRAQDLSDINDLVKSTYATTQSAVAAAADALAAGTHSLPSVRVGTTMTPAAVALPPADATGTTDRVTAGGVGQKSDGAGGQEQYAWMTVAEGSANKTYVNFSKGSGDPAQSAELYVNQGAHAALAFVGQDPSLRGKAGDGAYFLPDGSVAIKAAGEGYVLSGGVVTQIDTGSKTDVASFFAAHADAIPQSGRSGFACGDSSGLPTQNQMAAMTAFGVTIGGYGPGNAAMPANVFNASLSNVDGSRHWLGVGDNTTGQAFAQYDTSSHALFVSRTEDKKSAIPVQGYNPASKEGSGTVFLPDGSAAFKYNGDAYVESGGTVVSVTQPGWRQDASVFFAANPGAKPMSATSGFSNMAHDGVPTAAQAAAMGRYGVQVEGTSAAPAAAATHYVPEPTRPSTTGVPGGGVVSLTSSDGNYAEMGTWPDVQKVVTSNQGLAPISQKAAASNAKEGGGSDTYAAGTLENEGWQAYAIPGAHTSIIYNAAAGVQTPLHAFDTQTGKEVPLPQFLKDYGPSGSLVFSDGTRLDLKGNGASDDGNNGLTLISGDQLTTSDARVAPNAALKSPVQVTDATTVKNYLATNRIAPFNTAVQIGSSGNTQQFAFSNNATPGGAQAWGIAGDGSFGGQSQSSLAWLTDPNSAQNPAVTAALFPEDGYAPQDTDVSAGWTDAQLGQPPITEVQFHKQQANAAISVISSFLPGIGQLGSLGSMAAKGLASLGEAAGTGIKNITLLGKAGLRHTDDGAPAVAKPTVAAPKASSAAPKTGQLGDLSQASSPAEALPLLKNIPEPTIMEVYGTAKAAGSKVATQPAKDQLTQEMQNLTGSTSSIPEQLIAAAQRIKKSFYPDTIADIGTPEDADKAKKLAQAIDAGIEALQSFSQG